MKNHLQIVEQIKDGISVLQLNQHVMKNVFEREGTVKWGIFFLAVPAVTNLILAALAFPSGFSAIFSKFVFWPVLVPVLALGASLFILGVFVEKSFKIKVEPGKLFGVLAYASVFLWLTVFAFLLDVLGLVDVSSLFNLLWLGGLAWIYTVAYHFLTKVLGLTSKDALISVAVGVFCCFMIQLLLGKILVGSYYRIFY